MRIKNCRVHRVKRISQLRLQRKVGQKTPRSHPKSQMWGHPRSHPRNQLRNRKIHLPRILRIFFQKKKKNSFSIRPWQQQNQSTAHHSSGVCEFTSVQQKTVVEQLGKAGLVSAAEDTNMQNPEKVEAFYKDYLNGKDSMVTVFDVHRDGLIGAVAFIFRNGQLQTCYIGVRWKKDGTPEIESISMNNVAEINLTEKGYFIYAYETVIAHGCIRQYWRVSPLSEECRELTKKYISGLSYVDLNVLVTDWDSRNAGDVLAPSLYDAVYRIHTGKTLPSDTRRIPAEEYESIMTTYFPVTVGQLREHCGYDEDSGSYKYEKMHVTQYPPFGEVVDCTENADGTITLIVDGVWPDRNTDLAFRNTVVVQPFEDGTFRYLSNSVEEIPPDRK